MKKVIIPAAILALLFVTSCRKTTEPQSVEEVLVEEDSTAVITENPETNNTIEVKELQ